MAIWEHILKYIGVTEPTDKPELQIEVPFDYAKVEENSESVTTITANNVNTAFSDADNGDPKLQSAIAASLISGRDLVIAAHWRTRKRAAMGCDWDVCAVGKEDDKTALELRKMLDAAGIRGLISSLLDAAYFGYAGSAIEWEKSGRPKRFVPVHHSRWMFDASGAPAVYLDDTWKEKAVATLPFGSFAYAWDSTTGQLPAKAGLCRSLLWYWLLKRDAWLSRAKYLERFSMPFRKVTVTQEQWQNRAGLAALKATLLKAGEAALAILPEGAMMDVGSAPAGGTADYESYIKDIDDAITIAILGQLATSGDAGGLSKGQAQENVRADLLASDATMVMDAVNQGVLYPMCRFLYGDSAVGAYDFRIIYEEDEDMMLKSEVISKLSGAGYKAKKEWVEETFNMPLDEQEQVQPLPQTPDLNLTSLSDSAITREEKIQTITLESLRRLFSSSDAIAEFYAPLKKEIAAVFSDVDADSENIEVEFANRAQKLFSRYPAIYEAMGASSESFQDVFKQTLFTAVGSSKI